jgi:hypothetical protein
VTQRVVSQRIGVSLCAALLLLLTSCDALKNADGQSGSSQPLSSAACLDAQREAFPPLVGAWRKMAIAVTTANNAASPVTIQAWIGALDNVRSKTAKEGCPNPPQELEPLTALTADVEKTGGQITPEQIRGLGVLLRELYMKLQVLPINFDKRLLDLPLNCDEISQYVNATYSLRSLRTPAGRDVWVVVSIRNKSGRGVYAGVDGQLAASHPVKGGPDSLLWQRSLGTYAGPLKTSQYPLLTTNGERIHLTAKGRATALAAKVFIGFSAEKIDCQISAKQTGGAVTVAAAGDIACDPRSPGYNHGRGIPGQCHHKATSDLVKEIDPDAVFALGDLQYQAGTQVNFEDSYDPTWGRFKDITYPVPGNHEYGSPGAAGYFGYFGSRATPRDPDCVVKCRGYYSFDLGPWHVAALNVNCGHLPHGDGCGRRSAQNRWLQQDLKAANKITACTAVIMHEPRWSNSHWEAPELNALVKTMHKNGVDLLLSGDSHSYERFAPQNPASQLDRARGITQIVVGTGGAHFTGLHSSMSNTVIAKEDIFGVLKLTLQDGGYRWSYVSDPSTPFTDSGSRECH